MRGIYLLVPFLVPLGMAVALFFRDATERKADTPPPDLETLISKAVSEAVKKGLSQLCVEFEISDQVELDLLVVPLLQNGEKSLGFCFIKPSPVPAPPRFYAKQFDNGVLRYARVEAPASRQLGIIINGKEPAGWQAGIQ